MKIIVVAPLWLPIPAKGYGGIERVVFYLVNGLVEQGHHVTLYAPGGTQSKAQQLVSVYPRPLRDDGVDWSDTSYNLLATQQALAQAEKENFDVICFSVERPYYLPTIAQSKKPTAFTLHGVWTYKTQPKSEVDMLYAFKDQNFISISKSQQKEMPGLNYVANVYNGLDIASYPFNSTPKGYALWLGRFEKEKGAHLAIQVAKKVGMKIILAGPKRLELPAGKKYFEEQIQPHLNQDVVVVDEVWGNEKMKLFGEAAVLINPYVYKEAFGYVTLEALACGTPAVVPTWGAGSEIIEEGVSGFTGATVEEWSEAVKKASYLKREDCRKRAEKFDVSKMVAGYEQAFKKILHTRSA